MDDTKKSLTDEQLVHDLVDRFGKQIRDWTAEYNMSMNQKCGSLILSAMTGFVGTMYASIYHNHGKADELFEIFLKQVRLFYKHGKEENAKRAEEAKKQS